MSTLIDALKGLLKEMHGSVEPDVSFYRDELSEIIAEHERSAGWQPMSEAPTDGTRVTLWFGERVDPEYCRWRECEGQGGKWEDDYGTVVATPTHWQPLPKGPQP